MWPRAGAPLRRLASSTAPASPGCRRALCRGVGSLALRRWTAPKLARIEIDGGGPRRRNVCIGTKIKRPETLEGPEKPLGLLSYRFVEGSESVREATRQAHIDYTRAWAARGELLLGGCFEPADEALLIFSSEDTADRFAEGDPYVKSGVVADVSVREWPVVVGALFDGIRLPGYEGDE
mmetsp:Transcript_98890/g.317064  ORF Transcript_98890/g.317064 Transcript_98890/m.317064 type:complete len:179 (-) Transcript_98890:43-579(-)|eukprot:CAMPEP_0204240820 /NCGR_PEP_ID=MMETSP0361-20130328/95077_1 /ASSEMBLY_ACC=CAM_ASM_000343 /TAXON_ID=268821 /ORGANISM="Scrippsiella Hangoei, Strain SHTV-5" /LENGTH=178 /DNA_ID=CAMNT_0051213623 /DNA_START=54 /DNA_END=590 /DNA_ORIENTATION=+